MSEGATENGRWLPCGRTTGGQDPGQAGSAVVFAFKAREGDEVAFMANREDEQTPPAVSGCDRWASVSAG